MQLATTTIKSLLRIVAGVPIVSLTLGSLLYLALSVTWIGRCVALSGVTVSSLKQRVRDVRIKIYDDEGHGLLFSQPKSVLNDVFESVTTR
jgi:hypothetical protein